MRSAVYAGLCHVPTIGFSAFTHFSYCKAQHSNYSNKSVKNTTLLSANTWALLSSKCTQTARSPRPQGTSPCIPRSSLSVFLPCMWPTWLSGRTSVSGQRSFAVLRSTCSWRVTTYMLLCCRYDKVCYFGCLESNYYSFCVNLMKLFTESVAECWA